MLLSSKQKIKLRQIINLLAVFGLLLMTVSAAASQESSLRFPYQALVARQDALVRSGPGEVHYATEKLAPGDVVEVHRHDPGGWCAIRPTAGSFCIIPESTVDITDRGIGKVIVEDTTPFVGTSLGSVDKPLWQVKLKEGEKLAVIGQLSWPNPGGHSTIWYQIKPPAGEFRWIHISAIESLDHPSPARRTQPILHENKRLTVSRSGGATNSGMQNATGARNKNLEPPSRLAKTTSAADRDATSQIQPLASRRNHRPSTAGLPPRDHFTSVGRTTELAGSSNANHGSEPTSLTVPVTPTEPPSFASDVRQDSAVQPAGFAGQSSSAVTTLQNTGSGWRKATRPFPQPTNFDRPVVSSASQAATKSGNWTAGSRQFNSQNHQTFNRFADAAGGRDRFANQLNQQRQHSFSTLNNGVGAGLPDAPELRELNNRLTAEMLKAPDAWQLQPIVAATQQFLAQATPHEQLQGQQFLTKLASCQKISAGFGGGNQPINFNSFGGNPNSNPAVGRTVGVGQGIGATNVANENFDAVGWLNELKRAGGTAPSTYVLQDRAGKILYHITPIPGLNINRYLKSKVGVRGQRGFNHRLNLKHVTVERVFPL